jgi:ABC-type transporter MlaC component
MDFLMYSLLQSPVTSYLLHKNIFLITLFAKILSLSTSQNVKDLFLYPYKTTVRVKQTGRQKTLDIMVEGISGVQSTLNFFMNTIVTC